MGSWHPILTVTTQDSVAQAAFLDELAIKERLIAQSPEVYLRKMLLHVLTYGWTFDVPSSTLFPGFQWQLSLESRVANCRYGLIDIPYLTSRIRVTALQGLFHLLKK